MRNMHSPLCWCRDCGALRQVSSRRFRVWVRVRLHQQIGVLLYHIIFISLYYTHYDTIISHYDTIISLIFLQMSRLLVFIISIAPKKDYYFTYDTSIISLIFFRIDYCYYCYYHTIICIICISNYYFYYLFLWLLIYLFFSAYIISIIAITTLLYGLFLSQSIITIIFFEMYYVDYLFSGLLFQLWPLSHYYLHYVCVWLLSQLWLSNSIKWIIYFQNIISVIAIMRLE